MQLGSFSPATNQYASIRELTPEEIETDARFKKLVSEARNRLALFRILDRNYADWRNYLDRLLSPNFIEDVDGIEELNRFLLNYLTFAYSIQEHFSVSFRQRFKKDSAKLGEYSDFVDKLCQASWPFAFVLDYRGYFQHVGLGVGSCHRTSSDTSITIKIVADAKTLLSDSRDWKRSGLTVDKGEIDVVATLKEFHHHMMKSYAVFVAKTFFPVLQPASEFYSNLMTEVQAKDPVSRTVFFEKEPTVRIVGASRVLDMTVIFPPMNVFDEVLNRSGSTPIYREFRFNATQSHCGKAPTPAIS